MYVGQLTPYEEQILIRESVIEIATHLGDSMESPISVYLLCLMYAINHETSGKILGGLNLLSEKTSSEITLEACRNVFKKHYQYADQISELGLKAFIKAYARYYVPELLSFANSL